LLADAVAAPVPAVREIGLAPAAERFEEPPWTLLVRVLGPVDVVDRLGQPVGFERAKALELVVWLAEHRHHPTRSGARTALWESDVRDATFANVVSDARRALARLVAPPPEEEWIGRTYAEDLPLHRAVITDVELVAARLDHGRRQPDHEAVATLREGLALVRGMPYAGTSYLWPDGEALPSHHTVVVVHAALEMANRCLDVGDVDGVFWATAQGMRVLPAHDELVCLRMRAHSLQGNLAGVRREFECYERAVTADAWGGDLSPKVTDLRRRLAHPVTAG
jgi:two-component SAPR family response regulator